MSSDVIHYFFAIAAPVIIISVLVALYFSARGHVRHDAVPIGKTYACARCGRRGNHEHMVPITREGSVVWYCSSCARKQAQVLAQQ